MNKWRWIIKPKIRLLIWMAGIVTLMLIVLQGILLSYGINIQKSKFRSIIPKLMLEIHHSIEDDSILSQKLIHILAAKELNKQPDPELENEVIQILDHKIDSVNRIFGINLDYDFVIYHKEDQELYLKSGEHINSSKNFLDKSERAGWRVRKALGKHKYRIGLDYRNEYLHLINDLKVIIILSVLLISLLIFTFYFTLKGWKEQKELTELKNNFINNLTHELKTPIFSTSLLHSMIQKEKNGGIPDSVNHYLDLLEKENLKIKDRVGKVVDIALLEHNRLEVSYADTDIHNLIRESTEILQIIIVENNGNIMFALHAQKHVCAVDPVHFNGVIYNLVDNAIKYSIGQPDVTISTENSGNYLIIKIADKGIGIKPGLKDEIFDKFYRITNGDLHPVKGMGLGLSYVKSIIEVHKGTIKVQSRPGGGTTFIVALPLSNQNL